MVKKSLIILSVFILLWCQGGCEVKTDPIKISPNEVEVFFSPQGGCTQAVVKTLDQAKSSVLIQAYSFTSAPIAKAVVDAIEKGRVEAIVNSRPLRYSFMLNELSPKVGDWLMRISGVVDFQRRKVGK